MRDSQTITTTTTRPGPLLTLLVLAAVAGGCNEASSNRLATVPMRIGAKTFTLEIADTDAARTRGLMLRDSMPDEHGMIFVFADEAPRAFWMKNTRFPLDIIFVSGEGRVVSIKQMQSYVTRETPSDAPAKYAIELNQGAAAAAGVKVGDVLEIPPPARGPRR